LVTVHKAFALIGLAAEIRATFTQAMTGSAAADPHATWFDRDRTWVEKF
jgi:hypothetical protein